jgi:hypothetical protein
MLCNYKLAQLTPKAVARYPFNLSFALHFDSGPTVLLSAKFVALK